MSNIVTVSGMFGSGKTYFADSPVVIDISGLQWPASSPFNIVRLHVVYEGADVGTFHAETGGQSSISFDIQSALRAIWSGYDFSQEVAAARSAVGSTVAQTAARAMRQYSLRIFTEYMSEDDGGVFTVTQCEDAYGNELIPGGQCLLGGLTEWERSIIGDKANADVSHWEHTGVRYGDASTKPMTSPERVGINSITSWVDVEEGQTKSIFFPAVFAGGQGQDDDVIGRQRGWTGHAPLVLRDSMPYTDFLFVNSRGAVETCSARILETMAIDVETQQYTRVERPSFSPNRSVMAFSRGGRRSWSMSSGYQTRQWAEWWTMEFLRARQWWMLYKGSYVPVIVEPAKKSIGIYDRSKQEMPSVEFTATLALEG